MIIKFTAGREDENLSLNVFLRESGVSAAQIKRLKFLSDGIKVNGERQSTDYKIKIGDEVSIETADRPQEVEKSTVIPQDLPLEIVYMDSCCMVVEKPYDMPVHPSFNHNSGTLANAFAGYWSKRGQEKICRVLNRLDKNTSGLVLIALDAHSAELLKGGVDKTYIALTKGDFEQSQGVIDAPIARQEGSIITRCVSPLGQRAKTQYELIKQNCDVALVEIKLDTGRTHQIRVHFSHIGHPLLGDDLYGGDNSVIKRQALHCQSLEFISPDTKAVVRLSSPLPVDMQNLATRI